MVNRIEEKSEFRFIEANYKGNGIPCICLCYNSEKSARRMIKGFNDYLESGGRISDIKIRFTKSIHIGHHDLYIFAKGKQDDILIEIYSIESKYIERIIELTKTVKNYLVMAGYSFSKDFKIIPFEDFVIAKKELVVDSKEVICASQDKIDWKAIISKDTR